MLVHTPLSVRKAPTVSVRDGRVAWLRIVSAPVPTLVAGTIAARGRRPLERRRRRCPAPIAL